MCTYFIAHYYIVALNILILMANSKRTTFTTHVFSEQHVHLINSQKNKIKSFQLNLLKFYKPFKVINL